MDDQTFDRLARALGGASSRRAALASLLGGLAAGMAAPATDAKRRRRRRCEPACPAGQTCVKGTCTCANGGAVCGANCCTAGQTCQGRTCVDPRPQCLAFGAACKDTGAPCCDGAVCGSGQGGEGDVACYVPAGGACERTAQCVFGSSCEDGACVADPQPQPAPNCAVCASGCPFATIEAAIAAATAGGETITVAGGTYAPVPMAPTAEPKSYLLITRSLTLKACVPGQPVTVVCPVGSGLPDHCITAYGESAEVTIEGIEVEHSDPPFNEERGFASWNGAALTLRNVAARRFQTGVFAESSTIGTWTDATVTTAGRISITGTRTGNPKEPYSAGFVSNNQSHITVSGDISIANVKTGLDVGSGTLSCTAPISYTTTSVLTRCGDPFPGCPCS